MRFIQLTYERNSNYLSAIIKQLLLVITIHHFLLIFNQKYFAYGQLETIFDFLDFNENDFSSLRRVINVDDRELLLSRRDINRVIDNSMRRVEEMARRELRAVLLIKNPNSEGPQFIENMKIKMGFVSTMAADSLKNLMQQHGETDKYRIAKYLHNLDLNFTVMESECPYHYDQRRSGRLCRYDNPYREIDGFCNNIKYPYRGTSHYPAQRFIPADYGDGLNEPRRSVRGEELPNARIISNSVLPYTTKEHSTVTNMMMVFGQLMDHEFAFASSPTGFMFGKLKCCDPENAIHPLCMNMNFPQNDEFFSRYRITCMEIVRSLPAIDIDCRFGPRNQNNEVTSYIDASPIYGSTPEVGNRLRAFSRGELKIQPNPLNPRLKPLMPISNISSSMQCEIRSGPFKCFSAGDTRANENSLLIVIHTLFVREHNRIAQGLQKVNPRWEDERLYQEARKILGAVIQHICFKEFLPILIGQNNLEKYSLELKDTGYFIGYNSETDASVDHGFVTAAFRFGHSLIKDIVPDGMDPLLRGIFHQHAQNMDNHVVEDVRNHLFKLPHERFGMDLMALNIMRAREQGVPGYNDWREYCGLTRYRNWGDMQNHVIPSAIEGMRAAYKNVDDVDIFVGGISEIILRESNRKESDGILGPTFSCMIGSQFKNFRFGDRYWYENDNSRLIRHAFTPSQLQEIRKVRLSRVICDNSDSIVSITRNVFIQPSFENPISFCRDVKGIDFRHWRE
ncbi:lactoperoxidase-like [Gordionus sp. m RMFG-2023]|uniref:lactoperoxidase-like n=1 Tax=Gordionus sp. m RMFG-2023 TaxID=3053472 RepID=UPI0031FD5C19